MTPQKILIVDDDILSIATLTQILLQNGYQVLHAEDRDHAVRIAQRSRLDMIICNAENKKVDAVQFLKFVRQVPQARCSQAIPTRSPVRQVATPAPQRTTRPTT